ncbi:MAG TPA: VTT domain-containing protein [Gemmatimonadales bacterium]|nr:VTT domain-containing protein [Gemmatimonadales bacterium]
MVGWLTTLPPSAVYVVLAVLAFVENVLPVVPADVAVALGAFLSQRGTTAPLPVFLVVWIANVGGAAAVYFAARRLGRPFFATPLGRRLVSPGGVARLEREYLRFGVAGIFFARFLPGIRAVVPPFAGIFGLSTWRTMLPVAVASGIWYGGITLLGVSLGGSWEAIAGALTRLNQVLAVVAGFAILAVVVIILRKRRGVAEEPVVRSAQDALEGAAEAEGVDPAHAARLVLEIAYGEEGLTPGQRQAVARHLRERWGLPVQAERPVTRRAGRLSSLAPRLRERFSTGRRLALIEGVWQAAFAGGDLPDEEAWLMTRAGELLGFSANEIEAIRARLRAAGRA